jgi:3-oxoacyl-[acyl-carrier-protein] synthase-3
VTLLSDHPRWEVGKGVWSTDGARHRMLIRERGGALSMDGRGVFGFVMKRVPESVAACLGANGLEPDDVDRYLLHQASRYVVENLAHRMGLDSERVPFTIARHGNTVSSTLPILLSACMDDASVDTVVASGYGVGLSVGTVVLKRCR